MMQVMRIGLILSAFASCRLSLSYTRKGVSTKGFSAVQNGGRSLMKPLSARGRLMDELSDLDGTTTVDISEESLPMEKTEAFLEPETLFFEGPPSWTELVLPGISILTIIGIVPFAAAVARQVWVKYKVTSRRVSVQSGFGGNDFTEIIYPDVVNLKYVYRAGGSVGDMVIELKDGAKLEMRHVPDFQNIYKYILSRIAPDAREASFQMKEE